MSGEFELIRKFLAPLAGPGGLDLKDDAALFQPPAGRELVLTADALVGGVHFLDDDPPELIAKKALRVNLSDLAAMGAMPLGYLLTAAWPGAPADDWVGRFAAGLAQDQTQFAIQLLGGDTTTTPGPLTLSVTAIGHVAPGRALRRDQGRPGERVFVSGTIGDGALGLAARRGALDDLPATHRAALTQRYLQPEPRLALGRALSESGLARAAIDLSDGLAADLGHLLDASGLAATIELARVPLSPAAEAALALSAVGPARVLSGGDDYELLFTVAGARAGEIADLASSLDLELTEIGSLHPGQGLTILDPDGGTIDPGSGGWTHF